MAKKRLTDHKPPTTNHKLFSKAKRYLVGGVNSPVRAFSYVGRNPVLFKSGKLSRIYDYDGNSYIDYVLSWGAMILGHSHPEVVKNVKRAAEFGFAFGATNSSEIRLAEEISKAIPFIEKIRFVNSGTEAVMGAVRVARGYTGREKIVKFGKSYHGHADYLLAKAGSGCATLGIPSSAGVPKSFTKETIIAPANDPIAIEKIFDRHGRSIAAVLVEPVGGNYGVIPPDISFLKHLRMLTAKCGALLVFDEVITGFRFGFGSFAKTAGIVPDLICLGKIIGGGFPIGAFGGRKRIMERLAPLGNVYQASTFAGSPVVMEAGLATLENLKKNRSGYERTKALTKRLVSGIEAAAKSCGVELDIKSYGNMFSVKFSAAAKFRKFYGIIVREGIYFAPSEFEANFLSFAHTTRDVEKTVEAARLALGRI